MSIGCLAEADGGQATDSLHVALFGADGLSVANGNWSTG